jgi:hypothetical protein
LPHPGGEKRIYTTEITKFQDSLLLGLRFDLTQQPGYYHRLSSIFKNNQHRAIAATYTFVIALHSRALFFT